MRYLFTVALLLTPIFSQADTSEEVIARYKCYEQKGYQDQSLCYIRLLAAHPKLVGRNTFLKKFAQEHEKEIQVQKVSLECSKDNSGNLYSNTIKKCLPFEAWFKTIDGAKNYIELYQCKQKTPFKIVEQGEVDPKDYERQATNARNECDLQLPQLRKDPVRLQNKMNLIAQLQAMGCSKKRVEEIDKTADVALFHAKGFPRLLSFNTYMCRVEKRRCSDLPYESCPDAALLCSSYIPKDDKEDWTKRCRAEQDKLSAGKKKSTAVGEESSVDSEQIRPEATKK